MPNLECDFCNVFIENDGEGSAFCDGTAFSNIGVDDRIACPDCIDYLNEDEMPDDEWDSLTKDQQQDWQTYWNEDGNGDYDYLNERENMMTDEELKKIIYKTIKDWADEEAELNDHNEVTREDNFEDMCKQLTRWATKIKDDYKKYVDTPME